MCGKRYGKKGTLARHVRYECGKEPEFPCPHCPYHSKHRGNLQRHMLLKHSTSSCDVSEEKRFGCTTCGRKYKHNYLLRRHLQYECGIEPRFSCSLCPYKGNYRQSLQSHMVLKHKDLFKRTDVEEPQRKFKCDLCQRCYKHKFLLGRHQRYECGKEPQYDCLYCPYKAHYKQRLNTHMTMRHGHLSHERTIHLLN
ncbi:hypothetical protein J6590_014788 [Homalodisca vitripennis]|nr:hypothetical protein J6590_014788 [Homalodisca vitripennis]